MGWYWIKKREKAERKKREKAEGKKRETAECKKSHGESDYLMFFMYMKIPFKSWASVLANDKNDVTKASQDQEML